MADPAYGQSTSGPPPDIGAYRSGDLDRRSLVFTGTAAEAKVLQGLLKLDAQEVLTRADATAESPRASSRVWCQHGWHSGRKYQAMMTPKWCGGGSGVGRVIGALRNHRHRGLSPKIPALNFDRIKVQVRDVDVVRVQVPGQTFTGIRPADRMGDLVTAPVHERKSRIPAPHGGEFG